MRRKIAYLQLSVVKAQLPFIVRQLIIDDESRRRFDYRTENLLKVNVCGVECEF